MKWSSLAMVALVASFDPATSAIAREPDPALPSYAPAAPLSGRLNVAAGESMRTLLQFWMEILHRAHPNVEIVADVRDSSYAPKALLAGTAQVGFMGRLLWPEETADLQRAWHSMPLRVDVAGGTFDDRKKTQALAIFVHRDNPVKGLTFAQLDAIFSATRRRGAAKPVLTWGDLGLTGEWAQRPVHPVVVKTSVGHALYFREVVLLGGAWKSGMPEFAEDRVAPDGVAPDPGAIGLSCVPFGSADAKMVALAERESERFVTPTLDSVADRSYPLSRMLYLFVNRPPGTALDPVVREFVRVALSREGQQAALDAGFLPLPAAHVATQRAIAESPTALPALRILAPAIPEGGYAATAHAMRDALVAAGLAPRVDVSYVPGEGGVVGLKQFVEEARGDPTQLMTTGYTTVGSVVLNHSPVTLSDVTPIARLTGDAAGFAVPAASPLHDARELAAQLQRDPAGIAWAAGSVGGAGHTVVVLFALLHHVDPARLNFSTYGGDKTVEAVVSGHATVGIVAGYGTYEKEIKAGRMRLIAISSARRKPAIDCPTLVEQGIDLVFENWRGVVAAPGLDAAERKSIGIAIEQMVHSPQWQDTLRKKGWDDAYLSGAAFDKFLQAESTRLERAYRAAGLMH